MIVASGSTFVELFQGDLFRVLPPLFLESTRAFRGDESGVRLWLYLWEGRSGVIGVVGPRRDVKRDVFCRRRGTGSEEGARAPLFLFIESGVTGDTGDLALPVNLLANFLKGDIDLDIVLEELGARPLCGVARYPFCVDAVPDEPCSLPASPCVKI